MQNEPFQVGDIVLWHYPLHPEYCVSWAREYGPGPFEITEIPTRGGVFIRPLNSKPTLYLSGRTHPFNHEIFRCDQFLTAVRRAKINAKKT